ncbi:MAG: transporter substrate-binding domain-containing protein [Geminicoccaceae bacterium]
MCAMLVLLLILYAPWAAAAEHLDQIRTRGEVVIGVKGDYVPFGMVDPNGALVGIEADLAADLARRLGVGLRLVAVTSANRLQKLEEGSVDLIIATLGDTAERRAIADLIEPGYFASGANLMLRPDAGGIEGWSDLAGKPVCATQGALFNAEIASRYLLDLQTFGSNRDARLALRSGRCIGWLYDDIAIRNLLAEVDWADYRMPLPSVVATPWAIALPRWDRGSALERIVSDAVADWHRTGLLTTTMERWNVPPGDYLTAMHALWTARRADGGYVCQRQADGSWPTECRQESRIAPEDVTGLHRLALLVRERTGLNLSLLYDRWQQGLFVRGLLLTLALIVTSIAGSLAIGAAGAWVVARRVPVLAPALSGLATFVRMTPPLLLMYVIFFGVGYYIAVHTGWNLNAFLVAVVCLSAYAGAANLTAFLEAWRVLQRRGPRPGPAAIFALAYPPVMGTCVNIAKATGMASTIAVPDLVYASAGIVADEGNPGVMMNLLLVLYFTLVLVVVALFEAVRRRIGSHVRG